MSTQAIPIPCPCPCHASNVHQFETVDFIDWCATFMDIKWVISKADLQLMWSNVMNIQQQFGHN